MRVWVTWLIDGPYHRRNLSSWSAWEGQGVAEHQAWQDYRCSIRHGDNRHTDSHALAISSSSSHRTMSEWIVDVSIIWGADSSSWLFFLGSLVGFEFPWARCPGQDVPSKYLRPDSRNSATFDPLDKTGCAATNSLSTTPIHADTHCTVYQAINRGERA